MELFFDTETSGLPTKGSNYKDPKYPWIVQLAAVLSTEERIFTQFSTIIHAHITEPIHPKAQEVHGIRLVDTLDGMPETHAISIFEDMAMSSDLLVCHNFNFDIGLVDASLYRCEMGEPLKYRKDHFCTMLETTNLCKLPGRYGKYKWPKLEELYRFLFGEELEGSHDALVDVMATRKCYYELKRRERDE